MAPWFAILICLHLLAATVWVGGMFTMHFAVRPAAAATLAPDQRLPFMAATLARFLDWVAGAIVLLLLSGAAIIVLAGGMAQMHWSVHAMIGIGVLMMLLYGHIRFAPFARMRRAVAARQWPEAAAALDSVRRLVTLNLALGVIVYLIAVVARVF